MKCCCFTKPACRTPVPAYCPSCRLSINQLVYGKTRKESANHLGLSKQNVNGYVKSIFKNFDLHSRAQLFASFSHGDDRDS